MRHIRGSEIFAVDKAGFRRRIIDEGKGPVRSYSYSPGEHGSSPHHCHARSVELFMCVEGEGTVVVEGEEVRMRPLDVMIVEPGEFHYVKGGAEPFHMLAVVAPNLDDAEYKDGERP